jgi:hypothetical protein
VCLVAFYRRSLAGHETHTGNNEAQSSIVYDDDVFYLLRIVLIIVLITVE